MEAKKPSAAARLDPSARSAVRWRAIGSEGSCSVASFPHEPQSVAPTGWDSRTRDASDRLRRRGEGADETGESGCVEVR